MKKVFFLFISFFAVSSLCYAAEETVSKVDIVKVFNEPRPVSLISVKKKAKKTGRKYPAVVKASKKASLSFRVGGPIVEINVKPGDKVKKGQVLMRLDARDYEDSLRSVKALLVGAVSRKEKALFDYNRIKDLLEKKVISKARYDAARSAYDSAVSEHKQLKAQLKINQHKLKDTRITAPFNGVITEQFVEKHEMIGAGKVALAMHDISKLEIETFMPETDVVNGNFNRDTVVEVSLPAVPDHKFEASFKEINTEANPLSRTYSVSFIMEAPEDVKLFAGMTAEVSRSLEESVIRDVFVLPSSSIVMDKDKNSVVWVYNEESQTVSARQVMVSGNCGRDDVYIKIGLDGTERVVGGGASFVTENMKVKPIE